MPFRVQLDDPYDNEISELVEVRLITIPVTLLDNRTGETSDFAMGFSVDKSATDDDIIDNAKVLAEHMGFSYLSRGTWKETIISFDALRKHIENDAG